jgi:hypothetical protein
MEVAAMNGLVAGMVLGALAFGGSTLAIYFATQVPSGSDAMAPVASVATSATSTAAMPVGPTPGVAAPALAAVTAPQQLPSFLQPHEEDPVVADAEIEREERAAKRAKRYRRAATPSSTQQH